MLSSSFFICMISNIDMVMTEMKSDKTTYAESTVKRKKKIMVQVKLNAKMNMKAGVKVDVKMKIKYEDEDE